MGTLAVLEVLDRDGHVRHSVGVSQWPLRAGRALDNELVLDDPHVAAHHFQVDADEAGQVFITVGDTVNGLWVERQQLAAASRVPAGDEALPLLAGRTALRLRLAAHAVAAEQPLAATRALWRELGSLAVLALVVAALLAFDTYLVTEPNGLTRALASAGISALGVGLAWCGFLSVLSKVFTRQGHFTWHLRVTLCAVIAWLLIEGVSGAMAFVLSWPWLSDFSFVAAYAVVGAALYHHMLAIEPRHPRRWRIVGVAAAVSGVALALWFNHQASGRFGSELYMSHLLPPAMRLARPVEAGAFIDGLAELQKALDDKTQQDEADEADTPADDKGG